MKAIAPSLILTSKKLCPENFRQLFGIAAILGLQDLQKNKRINLSKLQLKMER